GRRVVHGGDAEFLAIAQIQISEICSADSYGVLQHGLENRLQFSRRTADDAQYLRGCGLLLQRFRELARQQGTLSFAFGGAGRSTRAAQRCTARRGCGYAFLAALHPGVPQPVPRSIVNSHVRGAGITDGTCSPDERSEIREKPPRISLRSCGLRA